MFQRLTQLFFGEGPACEPEEPKSFVSEEEDDGWLIIDIPEGSGQSVVGSSPLEDLLIEHPSMSVYITSGSIVVATEVTRESTEVTRERSPSKTRVERRAPHHASSVSAKAAILGKVVQVSRIQRAKAAVDRRKLGRKNLQRQNLVQQLQCRNATRQRNFVCQPRQRQCNH
ncbi:tumor protein p53-inducible nuclear protein 2 isoform 2-T2 [Gastrophryne carolinensis]